MAFHLASPAFAAGDTLPVQFTCDGANVSPPLRWSHPPPGTQAFALLMDDPEAPRGAFTHWIVADIPASMVELHEGQTPGQTSVSGVNDFSRAGYGGACPPRGHPPHRYRFRVFALDRALGIRSGVSRREFDAAIEGHVLAVAELTATYQRR
jgi:Raf kinase inhibitor-like YbhB/YbcL family protein